MTNQLFHVCRPASGSFPTSVHVFATGHHREQAKRKAHSHLGGDPETYVVTPLTMPGDRVVFEIVIMEDEGVNIGYAGHEQR